MIRRLVFAWRRCCCAPRRRLRNSAPSKQKIPRPSVPADLVEAGVDYDRDVYYPVSGLRGNLVTLPSFGVSLGVSSIAEIQI